MGAFFHSILGDKKTGWRTQVIDRRDNTKEYAEDGKDKQGTIQRPSQKDQDNHNQVDRHEGQGDRPMGKSPVQQQMMDMIPVRAERTAPVQNTDTEYPQGVQQRDHQYRKAHTRQTKTRETYLLRI